MNHGKLDYGEIYVPVAIDLPPVDPNGPAMLEALKHKHPCGLTGIEIEEKPLDYCDKCGILNDCIAWFANDGTAKTFEEYVALRKQGMRAQAERREGKWETVYLKQPERRFPPTKDDPIPEPTSERQLSHFAQCDMCGWTSTPIKGGCNDQCKEVHLDDQS
jgi:hypothetical protein